jgi:hypothetical protein
MVEPITASPSPTEAPHGGPHNPRPHDTPTPTPSPTPTPDTQPDRHANAQPHTDADHRRPLGPVDPAVAGRHGVEHDP